MTSESEGGSGAGTGTGTGTGGGGGSGNVSSQRSSFPWAQVVRGGGETDPVAPRSPSASPPSVLPEQNLVSSDRLAVIEPQTTATVENHPEGSEGSSNANASSVKLSVWNKPSANGVVEGSTTPVMGAASWPALSELTRPLPKSSSFPAESSSKSAPDPSVSVYQAPIIPQPSQKPVKPNAGNQSNQNHNHRQKSMKRGGGAGGGYNRPLAPPPPPPMPPYPLFDISYGGFVPAVLDTPVNNFVPRPMGGSHTNPMHDYSSNRKRNNFGSRPRGDGGNYANNGGHRRDHHDRDWRGPRGHGPRVPPPPPPPRGYMGPAPFIAPQLMRPYGAPMGYEMSFVYVPTGGPPLPPYIPVMNMPPSLPYLIQQQIEYYFSDANLVKDNYLRSNMDQEGWVPVTLIAGFRRVQNLTSDIQVILTSLRDSTLVEVQGETIRRRNDWRKWVNPSTKTSSQSQHTTTDDSVIESSLQKLILDELTTVIEGANGEVTPGDQFTNPESSNQDQ